MADNLGEVKVVIGADTSGLQQEVGKAKGEVSSLASEARESLQQTQAEFRNTADSVSSIGDATQKAEKDVKKLEESSKGLAKSFKAAQYAIRTLFVPLAIAGAIAGITKKVIDLITTTQQLQLAFNKVAEAAQNISSSMRVEEFGAIEQQGIRLAEQFNQQIDEARAKAEEFKASGKGFWLEYFGITDVDAQLQDTIKNIQKAQEDAQRILSERVRRDEEERARREQENIEKAAELRQQKIDQTAQRLQDAARDMEIDLLPESEQVEARFRETVERLRRQLSEDGLLSDAEIDAAVQRYERFLQIKAERDQQALEDRLAKEERAEIEKAERVAKATGDALQRELERAFNSISGSLGGDFTNFGDAIAAAIDRNTTALQRRVRP
jgi:hypothetical protein